MSKILLSKKTTASKGKTKPIGGIIIPPKGGSTFEQVDELVQSIKTELSGVQKSDTFVILNEIDELIKKAKSDGKSEDAIYEMVDKLAKTKAIYVEQQVPKRKRFQLIKIVEKYPRKYAKFITRFKFPKDPIKGDTSTDLGGIKGGVKGDVTGSVKKKVVIINNPANRKK